jgi:hypothetical protein
MLPAAAHSIRGLIPRRLHQHRRCTAQQQAHALHMSQASRMHILPKECTPQEKPRRASPPRDWLHSKRESVMVQSTACCTTAKTWQRVRRTAKQEENATAGRDATWQILRAALCAVLVTCRGGCIEVLR